MEKREEAGVNENSERERDKRETEKEKSPSQVISTPTRVPSRLLCFVSTREEREAEGEKHGEQAVVSEGTSTEN